MRGRAEIALVAVTIIWGTSFALVKAALADMSPVLFITARFLLAAVLLWAIYRRGVHRAGIWSGVLAGVLLFGAYVTQTVGLELTTPTKSAFLTALSIPMVPLLASLVYRSRPRFTEVAGILVATAGMILLTLPPGDGGTSGIAGVSFAGMSLAGVSRGDLLSFACAVLFALHIVVTGHFAPATGFASLTVVQAAVVAGLGLALFGVVEPVRFHPTPTLWASIALTGLFCTALAFTTMAWAQQYTSATRAALIFTLEPVAAWLTSWAMTGEQLANRGKVGAGIILAGILLGELTRPAETVLETVKVTGTS